MRLEPAAQLALFEERQETNPPRLPESERRTVGTPELVELWHRAYRVFTRYRRDPHTGVLKSEFVAYRDLDHSTFSVHSLIEILADVQAAQRKNTKQMHES